MNPATINSDLTEKTFFPGKFNGSNSSLTALHYRRNIKGVILGQAAVSRKCDSARAAPRKNVEVIKLQYLIQQKQCRKANMKSS